MSGASTRLANAATIKKIAPVFEAKGVPAWLWMPIAARESGFNTGATANTSSEYSKGLFQINVKAHPQYINTDLYDPVVNATIARDVFIAPAYEIAKSITSDPKKQALIVYSGLKNPESLDTGEKAVYIKDGGIRPKWTTETRDAFLKYYDQYAGVQIPNVGDSGGGVALAPVEGQGAFSMGTAGGSGGSGAISMTPEGMEAIAAMPSAAQKWGKVGIILLIIVVMAVAVFIMIGKNPVMAIVQKVGQGGETS